MGFGLVPGFTGHLRLATTSNNESSGVYKVCTSLWHALNFLPAMSSPGRLCGLVVRVLGYRSGGPGSIPGTTRKKSSGSGTGSTQPREYN
jgi:hypothetical protein